MKKLLFLLSLITFICITTVSARDHVPKSETVTVHEAPTDIVCVVAYEFNAAPQAVATTNYEYDSYLIPTKYSKNTLKVTARPAYRRSFANRIRDQERSNSLK